MNEKNLGKRIQKLRKERGLSQEEVEKLLGLPQKALTRMESGERGISTLEISLLAELFHMSAGDLLAEDEEPLVALYRAAPNLEEDPKIQEEVDRYMQLCKEGVFLESLLNALSRHKILSYSLSNLINPACAIKQGEQIAKEERKRLGIGNLPIHDIAGLLSSQGIWCAGTPLPPEMSGLFLYYPSLGMIILVNANDPKARQRFSFAHEYAHALLDSDQKILITDNKYANESNRLIEIRANAFAAAFLLPAEGVAEMLQSLGKGASSRTHSAIFDIASRNVVDIEERQLAKQQKINFQDVALVASRFGVSYQATVYRLYSLDYLSQKERAELLDEELQGKHYLRMLDHDDLEQKEKSSILQQELKTRISRLIVEAYRQEKISRGRAHELSKLLKLPGQQLLEWADIETGM